MGKKRVSKTLEKSQSTTTWFLDENLTASGEGWLTDKKVVTAATLGLLGTEDKVISSVLSAKFDNVIVVTANRKVDSKGDYFDKPNAKTGYVLFGKSLAVAKAEVKIEYLKKFESVVKNPSKLVGATVTLSDTQIVYKKGKKQKTISYKQFI